MFSFPLTIVIPDGKLHRLGIIESSDFITKRQEVCGGKRKGEEGRKGEREGTKSGHKNTITINNKEAHPLQMTHTF